MDVDEPVEIVAFDPTWTEAAHTELRRLAAALSAWPVFLEHIGSTAVPGCAAKPVVDLLAGTRPDDRQHVAEAIEVVGYESLGEAAPGRIYLRRRGERSFNVHVVEHDSELWRDNLMFREYLRADRVARQEYVAAKVVAARANAMLLAYSTAKSPTISELLSRARATQRDR